MTNNPTDSSSRPEPKQAADAAKTETANVAQTAVDASNDVAQEAKAQVADVAGQAKQQVSTVVNQARSELKMQADTRAEQAAAGLQSFADQLGALSGGRPEDAGHVGTIVSDAQQRVHAYAQTLQTRGPQAVIDDLATFARKRPIVFLFSAAVAGFAAGRLARATAAVKHDDTASSDDPYDSDHHPSSMPLAASASSTIPELP